MAISHSTYLGNGRPRGVSGDLCRPPRHARTLTEGQRSVAESSHDRIRVRPGIVWTLSPEVIARFWSYVAVNRPESCWLWMGGTVPPGLYGAFAVPSPDGNRPKMVRAHRLAYELVKGEFIPEGLEADHDPCNQPLCCNPAHIVPRTGEANKKRNRRALRNAGACKRGHPYSPDGVYQYAGGAQCKACARERRQRRTA